MKKLLAALGVLVLLGTASVALADSNYWHINWNNGDDTPAVIDVFADDTDYEFLVKNPSNRQAEFWTTDTSLVWNDVQKQLEIGNISRDNVDLLSPMLDSIFANLATSSTKQNQQDSTLSTHTAQITALTASTTKSFSYPTRSLNSCFQVSTTTDAFVTYSVDIAATLSLVTGQTGTVFMETYSDSGCSTGTQEVARFVNGNAGTLTVGLNLTQNITGTLSGVIQKGKWVQLRTANTIGTPTFTFRSAQEVRF